MNWATKHSSAKLIVSQLYFIGYADAIVLVKIEHKNFTLLLKAI